MNNLYAIGDLTTNLAFIALMLVLAVWSLIWKGLALWHAAQLKHQGWFIALLIINTAGILDIIYIFLVAKKQKPATPATPQRQL